MKFKYENTEFMSFIFIRSQQFLLLSDVNMSMLKSILTELNVVLPLKLPVNERRSFVALVPSGRNVSHTNEGDECTCGNWKLSEITQQQREENYSHWNCGTIPGGVFKLNLNCY